MRELLTCKETAERLRIKSNTLDGWRVKGLGPRHIKMEGKVLYRVSDIDDYLNENTIDPKGIDPKGHL